MIIAWFVFCAFVAAIILVARIKDVCSERNFYTLMMLTILAALGPVYC